MEDKPKYDFSLHTHTVDIFTNSKGEEIRIDTFQEEDYRMGLVKFKNDENGLTVTGDFGVWVFERNFIPCKGFKINKMYWSEKLIATSIREYCEYDPIQTCEAIEAIINNDLEDWGYEGEELENQKEFYEDLLNYVDDEIEYKYHAYRSLFPFDVDHDGIPYFKKGSVKLDVIFDAFEEICRRMK
ncbi:hypothetical protein [Flammeovirga sp. OC4]|uniref:hypothetical protein n=1 Tax=Flammeovirga sp. OC4 TaxID=1382345 RepID=UPI0005C55FB5|nr:hypothetical protein [Flammeovirga sp. OC4]